MNLYVASYRLHGTLDRGEVLAAIRETVVDLVGSEDFGVFEFDPGSSALSLVASVGIEEERCGVILIGSRPVDESAMRREIWSTREGNGGSGVAGEEELTAFIPLQVDGLLVGAIAIFSLLPQKGALDDGDHELFELLATQAATALFCTRMRGELEEAVEAAG
jgi:GAF domain-containing protein